MAEERTIRILATSDFHGKLFPWDYALNEESTAGSLAQLSTAVKSLYDPENTLLVDAGDSIQDNFAEIFKDEEIHPMIAGINDIGYEVWTTGNHDYDFGMDAVHRCIKGFKGKTLLANVYDPDGNPLADGYAIFEKNGIRIAVIGMTTPCIAIMNAASLGSYTVTDPVEEAKKIIAEIEGQYDILVGVMHMTVKNEYTVPHSGVRDLTGDVPGFDIMISSHEHRLIEGEIINDVFTVQNKYRAETMMNISVKLQKKQGNWKISDISSETVMLCDYEPDEAFTQKYMKYHEAAIANAVTPIGWIKGSKGIMERMPQTLPAQLAGPTFLTDLLLKIQRHYTKADVTAVCVSNPHAVLEDGVIRKCDIAKMYKFENTLYTFRMSGRQLRMLMEVSARFYRTWNEGDERIKTDSLSKCFTYLLFGGVCYDIDISREAGDRIRRLRWLDGRPVREDEMLTLAINDYWANVRIMNPGNLYKKDDIPELLEKDVRSDVGLFRDMIEKYIREVKSGVINRKFDRNWRLTAGNKVLSE